MEKSGNATHQVRNTKNVYRLSDTVYTYGHPGEYAPRVERVVTLNPRGGRSRPQYRRVAGGEIPAGLRPEKTIPLKLMEELDRADRTPEA